MGAAVVFTRGMNKNRTFIKNLTFGDRFVLPEHQTVYVAQTVRTMDGYTRVVYRVEGDDMQHEMVRRNLSTVDILA